MFQDCYYLSNLDLSNFDARNVITIADMFNACRELTTIYVLDSFVTTNVDSIEIMFRASRKSINFLLFRVKVPAGTPKSSHFRKASFSQCSLFRGSLY